MSRSCQKGSLAVSTSDQNPNPFRGPAWDELVIALEKTRTGLRVSSPGIDTHAALLRGGHTWQNWAKNQEATPHHWHRPNSEHDVTKVITEARDANEKVRVLGKGYSFSPLVPTDDHIVDVTHMNTCSVDVAQKTVTAGPGTTIDELERALQRKKLCLETAPVIPWVTLGGALGTGVHGTGSAHGTLADLVVEARVVDANSKVHGISNLYVAGSSIFPTYGSSNPTLNLVALTLRLADQLKKVMA